MARTLSGNPGIEETRRMQEFSHRMGKQFELKAVAAKHEQFKEWIKLNLEKNQKALNRYANEANRP